MLEDFEGLKSYLRSKTGMRMSHVYKPVLLLTLINNNGVASTSEIAREFILADAGMQKEYEKRVYPMPGKRLEGVGLIERHANSYKLSKIFDGLSDAQLDEIKGILSNRIDDYLGLTDPFNTNVRGYIPGRSRFEILKRAGNRCELCGISSQERQLDVDHIQPVSKGGSNDESNFQVLCRKCNAQKGNRDNTDFRAITDSFNDRDDGCYFCQFQNGHERLVKHDQKLLVNDVAYALYDGYPVTEGHTLFIPKRHVANYFDLYRSEVNGLNLLLEQQKNHLEKMDASITGWNIGINVNTSAGQTVMHVHMHLIPRRDGDMVDPRGGVRGVIPSKQNYKI
ncbi:HIT domain-containing protein [Methylophaga sp. OBS3]|uniref:HIT domain-containing protein n=1 Tax=Methylophaga sp. OBS3 TaxID=2991934 RepID=UPI00224C840F|nr:HIT domain-containing protein [Methylophaga sp. OBS3]MCX4190830.1 HIT domain-containing protein [Methylophaga sp. OBS3]